MVRPLVAEKIDVRKRQYSPLADRTIGYVRNQGDELYIPVGIENAFNEELIGEICDAMGRLTQDANVRVIVLTGTL